MKSFEEVKEEILKRGKENNACQSGYAKAFRATDKIELLNAIPLIGTGVLWPQE